MLFLIFAATSKRAKYIYVPGVTQPRQRILTKKVERARLDLVVALMPGPRPNVVVKAVAGTTTNTGREPAKKFQTAKGEDAKGMCGAEYVDFLEQLLPQGLNTRSRGQALMVIHDRGPAHNSNFVKPYCEKRGVRCAMLPPRSPDLDPLDYAVFGQAKRIMEDARPTNLEAFNKACLEFINKLQGMDAGVQTAGFRERLDAVVTARGGHICV